MLTHTLSELKFDKTIIFPAKDYYNNYNLIIDNERDMIYDKTVYLEVRPHSSR